MYLNNDYRPTLKFHLTVVCQAKKRAAVAQRPIKAIAATVFHIQLLEDFTGTGATVV